MLQSADTREATAAAALGPVSVRRGTVADVLIDLPSRQIAIPMTSEPLDLPEHRKARGAFFTPAAVAEYAVTWAVRSATDRVLEPSCGEAAFLLPAAHRLRDLGAATPQLHGFELHAPSAERARGLLAAEDAQGAHIGVGDFLLVEPRSDYSAVVGNPPYVRYQGFTGSSREAGRLAALAQGVRLTNLASSWAPFVVHSAAFLNPAGRLALVLPAELLTSNYAADVRAFLLNRFAMVRVVMFDSLVFPGVQTEAVLLLAEGSGGTSQVQFAHVRNAYGLVDVAFDSALEVSDVRGRWSTALAGVEAPATLRVLADDGVTSPLEAWGRLSLGAVTGANSYFTLSLQQVRELGLAPSDLLRISPPGSTHLRSLSLTRSAMVALDAAGARTLLFRPETPSDGALRYIVEGERLGIHERYKCRVRAPWWRVPLTTRADLFVTYMNGDTVQLCHNPMGVRHLNSVHGLTVDADLKPLARLLAVASLNSATMLSAELEGRAYGGGILKVEPREAARLAVPAPSVVQAAAPELQAALPEMRKVLKRSDLAQAVSIVDSIVLRDVVGLSGQDVAELRRTREAIAYRRANRSRTAGK